jgi:steroid delta-isomerase-like uncharacterized protein
MTVEDNKNRARQVAELVSTGNMALVDENVAPDFVRHDLGGRPDIVGPEGVKLFVGVLRAAFPDIQMIVEDVIGEGDRVVVRYTLRGTHRGAFRGIAPTGRKVTWSGINIYRVEGGKVVETWQLADALGVMQQLGVVPRVGQARG